MFADINDDELDFSGEPLEEDVISLDEEEPVQGAALANDKSASHRSKSVSDAAKGQAGADAFRDSKEEGSSTGDKGASADTKDANTESATKPAPIKPPGGVDTSESLPEPWMYMLSKSQNKWYYYNPKLDKGTYDRTLVFKPSEEGAEMDASMASAAVKDRPLDNQTDSQIRRETALKDAGKISASEISRPAQYEQPSRAPNNAMANRRLPPPPPPPGDPDPKPDDRRSTHRHDRGRDTDRDFPRGRDPPGDRAKLRSPSPRRNERHTPQSNRPDSSRSDRFSDPQRSSAIADRNRPHSAREPDFPNRQDRYREMDVAPLRSPRSVAPRARSPPRIRSPPPPRRALSPVARARSPPVRRRSPPPSRAKSPLPTARSPEKRGTSPPMRHRSLDRQREPAALPSRSSYKDSESDAYSRRDRSPASATRQIRLRTPSPVSLQSRSRRPVPNNASVNPRDRTPPPRSSRNNISAGRARSPPRAVRTPPRSSRRASPPPIQASSSKRNQSPPRIISDRHGPPAREREAIRSRDRSPPPRSPQDSRLSSIVMPAVFRGSREAAPQLRESSPPRQSRDERRPLSRSPPPAHQRDFDQGKRGEALRSSRLRSRSPPRGAKRRSTSPATGQPATASPWEIALNEREQQQHSAVSAGQNAPQTVSAPIKDAKEDSSSGPKPTNSKNPQELRQHLQSLAQKIMADPATIARQAQAQKDEATNDQQTREKHLTEKMDFAKRDANAERMRERIEAMKAQHKEEEAKATGYSRSRAPLPSQLQAMNDARRMPPPPFASNNSRFQDGQRGDHARSNSTEYSAVRDSGNLNGSRADQNLRNWGIDRSDVKDDRSRASIPYNDHRQQDTFNDRVFAKEPIAPPRPDQRGEDRQGRQTHTSTNHASRQISADPSAYPSSRLDEHTSAQEQSDNPRDGDQRLRAAAVNSSRTDDHIKRPRDDTESRGESDARLGWNGQPHSFDGQDDRADEPAAKRARSSKETDHQESAFPYQGSSTGRDRPVNSQPNGQTLIQAVHQSQKSDNGWPSRVRSQQDMTNGGKAEGASTLSLIQRIDMDTRDPSGASSLHGRIEVNDRDGAANYDKGGRRKGRNTGRR